MKTASKMKENIESLNHRINHTNTAKELAEDLNQDLNRKFSNSFYRYKNTESPIGEVSILQGNFPKHLNFYSLNFKISEPLELAFEIDDNDALQFIFCMKGNLGVVSKGLSRTISENRLCVLKLREGNTAKLKFDAGKEYHFSWLNFHSQDFHRNKEEWGGLEKSILMSQLAENDIICHTGNYNLKINDLHQDLYKLPSKSLLGKLMLKAKCNELLVEYLVQLEKEIVSPGGDMIPSSFHTKAVNKAKEIISSEISDNPTVPKIASKVGMSSSQLQRCFRLNCNQSVNDYIKEQRLEQGKQLLKHSDFLISEIVYKLGLSSKSYFSKIFKQKYQKSPSDYRRDLSLKD